MSNYFRTFIGDISNSYPPPPQWLADLGLRSFMGVKLRGEGEAAIGLISVRAKEANLYRQRDMDLLNLIALQVAPAIKNAQLLEKIDEFARGEERSRISRDMHDSVSQGLSSLLWQVDELERSLDSHSDNRKQLLEGVRRAANYSLLETRNAIWNLRPEHLDSRGLPDALRKEIERLVAPSRIEHTIDVTGSPIFLTPLVELTVLRICQEAVANAVWHSRATKISVHLNYGSGKLMLEISDDGRGFDVDAALLGDAPGMGIANLVERARQVSGTLEIGSSASTGTSVVFTVENQDEGES